MTISDFDPRLISQYDKPKFLLHFQWKNSSDVHRYALVEVIKQNKIVGKSNAKYK